MIAKELLDPVSIVVIGASEDIHKPGGSVLKNLLKCNFKGKIYAVNPKETEIQGVKCFSSVDELPHVDCAIMAIAAKYCPSAVDILAYKKGTKGFIIISAGFAEENAEGAEFERHIANTINNVGGSLIGPNCTGFLNRNYCGAFTSPIPTWDPHGVDFITSSGATAVFILEYGISNGLTFNSVWAVGNSAQLGIEDVLEHLNETFDPEKSSKVIMLYMEKISDSQKLLKHARSLIFKGCRIAAIKSGSSAAGSRAASSHTGALATNDSLVDALFRKAGIVRCHNRQELTTVCEIFMHPEVKGKNMAIITHAGGPAVMLTDVLSNNGMNVPHLESPKANTLLEKLYNGSSVGNPIDFLATGTAEQLGYIIDACENDFDNIDSMCVIFGSPGLFQNWEVYKLLDEKMKTCKKPIFPIIPSIINVKDEIEDFIKNKHRINFPEECVFGNALCKIYNTPKPQPESVELPKIDKTRIRKVIDNCENGYIGPDKIYELLDAAGISQKQIRIADKKQQALDFANEVGYPIVMKVVGPVHKSDVGGVTLNICDIETVDREFDRLMAIKNTYAVEISPMLYGTEVYIGTIRDKKFGHQVFFGLGGIFIEVLKDVQNALAPISAAEAKEMMTRLHGYRILQGVRGQQRVNIDIYAEQVARVSALVMTAPEIAEMDLNPLLGNPENVVAVDARIKIEK